MILGAPPDLPLLPTQASCSSEIVLPGILVSWLPIRSASPSAHKTFVRRMLGREPQWESTATPHLAPDAMYAAKWVSDDPGHRPSTSVRVTYLEPPPAIQEHQPLPLPGITCLAIRYFEPCKHRSPTLSNPDLGISPLVCAVAQSSQLADNLPSSQSTDRLDRRN